MLSYLGEGITSKIIDPAEPGKAIDKPINTDIKGNLSWAVAGTKESPAENVSYEQIKSEWYKKVYFLVDKYKIAKDTHPVYHKLGWENGALVEGEAYYY